MIVNRSPADEGLGTEIPETNRLCRKEDASLMCAMPSFHIMKFHSNNHSALGWYGFVNIATATKAFLVL